MRASLSTAARQMALAASLAAAHPLAAEPRALEGPPAPAGTAPSLLLLEDPALERVHGALALRGLAPDDDVWTAGLGPVHARLLAQGGCRSLSGAAFGARLAELGASLDARALPGATVISFSCEPGRLEELLSLAVTLLLEPAFPREQLEASIRASLEASAAAAAGPSRECARAVRSAVGSGGALFAASPTPGGIGGLERGELERHHRALTAPTRIAAGLLGGPGLARRRPRLEAILARLERAEGDPYACAQADPPPSARLFLADRPDSAAFELSLLGPAMKLPATEAAAVALAAEYLDQPAIRAAIEAELARELGAPVALRFGALAGSGRPLRFEAWCRVPAAKAGAALSALPGLAAHKASLAAAAELEAASTRLTSALGASRSSPAARIERAVLAELPRVGAELTELDATILRALTPAELALALTGQLAPERTLLVAVGPAAAVEDALEPYGPATSLVLEAEHDPRALLARLFEGVGGRESWERARYLETRVTHRQGAAPPLELHTWRDLAGPRLRVERELSGGRSLFLLNEERALTVEGGRAQDHAPQVHALLVQRSWRELPSALRLLALAPPGVVRASGPNRIELSAGPAAGAWLELDGDGRPARGGWTAPDGAESLAIYSDWRERDGLVAPAHIEMRPQGWARELLFLARHDELPPELFARP